MQPLSKVVDKKKARVFFSLATLVLVFVLHWSCIGFGINVDIIIIIGISIGIALGWTVVLVLVLFMIMCVCVCAFLNFFRVLFFFISQKLKAEIASFPSRLPRRIRRYYHEKVGAASLTLLTLFIKAMVAVVPKCFAHAEARTTFIRRSSVYRALSSGVERTAGKQITNYAVCGAATDSVVL